MEISYGLVNLMYFMLCSEHWRIKGSRSNKRRKLLTCFTNNLFKVYNNLSLRETGPEVYNSTTAQNQINTFFSGITYTNRWRFLPYDLIMIQNWCHLCLTFDYPTKCMCIEAFAIHVQ